MVQKHRINIDQFKENITKANAKDLVFIAKYSKQKKKYQKAHVFITSIIATMTGAAISLSYVFPGLEKETVTIASIFAATLTVTISYWQRKKNEDHLISKLLKTIDDPSERDLKEAESFRTEVLEAIKAEEK